MTAGIPPSDDHVGTMYSLDTPDGEMVAWAGWSAVPQDILILLRTVCHLG